MRMGEVGWLRRGERPKVSQGQECGDIELKVVSHSQHENQALCTPFCNQWMKQNSKQPASPAFHLTFFSAFSTWTVCIT